MKPSFLRCVAVILLAVVCSGYTRELPRPLQAPLQLRMQQFLADPRFEGASWGVKVVAAGTGEVWFEHNPKLLLSPASNSKLYTVALALDRLGPDYRIRTSLSARGSVDPDGALNGDLLLQGRGDPCINVQAGKGDIFAALQPLVAAVTNAGIRTVTGELIADESFFRGPRQGAGWAWDDLFSYYGAEISALTINDNTVEARVSPGAAEGEPATLELFPPTSCLKVINQVRTAGSNSLTRIAYDRGLLSNEVTITGTIPLNGARAGRDLPVVNPAALFGSWLRDALERAGVKLAGPVRVVSWPEAAPQGEWRELGCLQSMPLADLAREVQKPSQNLYTDLLLAQVGERARTNGSPERATSEDLGIAELGRFLPRAGIPERDVHFEEGSGLSRNNLTTARATIALLEYMSRHQAADVYWAALPVAGVDGTLRNRFKGTAAAGRLEAKTGTLRWAASLSGRVRTAGGDTLLFSFMLNRYVPAGNRTARTELDALALMLAEHGARPAAN